VVKSWKVILATMVIFGAGVLTGGLAVWQTQKMDLRAQQRPSRPGHSGPITAAGDLRLEFLRRAQRELDLSPAQRESIDKIIKQSQERTHKLMEPVAPELHAELQRTKEQFLQVLNPSQRMRFEQIVNKKQQRPHEPRHPANPP
jgi:hypothetical protein